MRYLIGFDATRISKLAQASPVPALRTEREERGTPLHW